MTYSAFFQSANRHPPYDWQVRLAGAGACQSRLIDIPTGLGKTAGVVLAWLWNRLGQPDRDARHQWPRRLVYCLPMRTLVEQTEAEVRGWVEAGLFIKIEPLSITSVQPKTSGSRSLDKLSLNRNSCISKRTAACESTPFSISTPTPSFNETKASKCKI